MTVIEDLEPVPGTWQRLSADDPQAYPDRPTYRFEYALPEGVTAQSVQGGDVMGGYAFVERNGLAYRVQIVGWDLVGTDRLSLAVIRVSPGQERP